MKVLDPKKINGDVVDAIKSEVTAMTANRHPQIVTVLAASAAPRCLHHHGILRPRVTSTFSRACEEVTR